MCQIIYYKKHKRSKMQSEIDSVQDFIDATGVQPLLEEGYNDLMPDCCLCQIDISQSLKQANIAYEYLPWEDAYYLL